MRDKRLLWSQVEVFLKPRSSAVIKVGRLLLQVFNVSIARSMVYHRSCLCQVLLDGLLILLIASAQEKQAKTSSVRLPRFKLGLEYWHRSHCTVEKNQLIVLLAGAKQPYLDPVPPVYYATCIIIKLLCFVSTIVMA